MIGLYQYYLYYQYSRIFRTDWDFLSTIVSCQWQNIWALYFFKIFSLLQYENKAISELFGFQKLCA